VILWQFTEKGRPDLIYNKKTKHPINKDGKLSADLNVSIKERDEFMKLLFGKIPPKPSSVNQILTETLAQVEKMKEAGITPEVQININMADLDIKALKTLQGKLEKAGVSSQVQLNIQTGANGAVPRGSDPIQDPDSGQPEAPSSEPEPDDSFLVKVKVKPGTNSAVQSFKKTKKNGVPIMGPHNKPRIRLSNDTQLRVSKTYKVSDKDSGDGVIHGDADRLYYKITDDPSNDKAAGLFVKKVDVRKV
jgi:hypothetical protein